MYDTSAALAVLMGLAVRLMVPIVITIAVVALLTRLDNRWQSEAAMRPLKVQKPQCWKTKHCSPEARKACAGYKSAQPCWQAFRLPSGYLSEKCLGCPVLSAAPIPIGS